MSTELEEKIFKELKLINKRLDNHDKKFESNDKRFKSIDKRFESIDKRFDKIEDTLEIMKRSIILIEEQVTKEIPVLFEAYSMQHDKQTLHQNDINSLNRKVEDHDIRISILENNAI